MNVSVKGWLQAVWMSLIEPADMARKITAMRFETRDLWQGLVLVAVLNVLLRALTRVLMPDVAAFQDQFAVVSHFTTVIVIGSFMVGLVFGVLYAGRMLDGVAELPATLGLMVWFQVVMFTLELGQLLLALISPFMAAIYGMIMLGGLLWCLLNFINVVHAFNSLGKAAVTLVLALVASLLLIPIVLLVLGIGPVGGTE